MFSMEYCEVRILNAVYTFSHNILTRKIYLKPNCPFVFSTGSIWLSLASYNHWSNGVLIYFLCLLIIMYILILELEVKDPEIISKILIL